LPVDSGGFAAVTHSAKCHSLPSLLTWPALVFLLPLHQKSNIPDD
jgi:hypothetical protein